MAVQLGAFLLLRAKAPSLACRCSFPPCRLKSLGGNKTVEALLALGCSRRVLLTGTPVQNNLDEFYGEAEGKGAAGRGRGNREQLSRARSEAVRWRVFLSPSAALLSFVAPNVLDSPSVFKRVFSDPISKGRDRDATKAEKELGEARAG